MSAWSQISHTALLQTNLDKNDQKISVPCENVKIFILSEISNHYKK